MTSAQPIRKPGRPILVGGPARIMEKLRENYLAFAKWPICPWMLTYYGFIVPEAMLVERLACSGLPPGQVKGCRLRQAGEVLTLCLSLQGRENQAIHDNQANWTHLSLIVYMTSLVFYMLSSNKEHELTSLEQLTWDWNMCARY